MTSKTHDLFAFASLITVAANYPLSSLNVATLATSSVGAIVGSLLPDIDQASNRLWDMLPAGHFLGRILKGLFLSHRTISHSLLGIYLVNMILSWVLPVLFNVNYIDIQITYYAIMIGFLSHLLLDSFTEGGIPLLFPIKMKVGFPPIASWRIKTGKWFEKFIVFPGIVIYLLFFAFSNSGRLIGIFKLVAK